MIEQTEIYRASARFIENGTIPETVRPLVVSSWQRSQHHGISVERTRAPTIPETELIKRYSAHSPLLEAARPALRQARLFLADADSMIVVTDPSGLILEAAGDPRTIDFGQVQALSQSSTGTARSELFLSSITGDERQSPQSNIQSPSGCSISSRFSERAP
ncbi:MAG TPA: hypothetical protein VE860_04335 [Chthoniobacterales bacterium]|jgi:transcriptional regulator of acetoin/glycerol metabolism|nr:hypothetical protein [Chthoniobacterales bacterium]